MIVATDVYFNLEYEFNFMKGMLGTLLGFLAIGPIFAFLVGGFVMPEFVSFVSDPVPYMDIADLISTSSLYSAIGVLGVFALLLFFGDAVPKEKRLLWFFVLLLGNILVFPVFWFVYFRNWPVDAHVAAQLTG